MPQPYKITLQTGAGESPEVCEGEIPDEDWRLLLQFADEADSLLSADLLTEGLDIKYRVQWREGEVEFSGETPSEDEFALLLHRLRPFILQKEASNFLRMCNLLKKNVPSEKYRGLIDRFKGLFLGHDMVNALQVKSHGVVLNSEAVFQQWINAYEYHRDADKRGALEDLHDCFPLESTKVFMISLAIDKANAVAAIRDLIRGLETRGGRKMTYKL